MICQAENNPASSFASYFPLIATAWNFRFKRDIESEDTKELFFTTPHSISNISVEEPGNFTEEVPFNTTTEVPLNTTREVPINTTTEVPVNTTTEVPQQQQPSISEVKQIVTQEYPTYHRVYTYNSDNMAKEATFLGMVREGEIAAKQRMCFYLP